MLIDFCFPLFLLCVCTCVFWGGAHEVDACGDQSWYQMSLFSYPPVLFYPQGESLAEQELSSPASLAS